MFKGKVVVLLDIVSRFAVEELTSLIRLLSELIVGGMGVVEKL